MAALLKNHLGTEVELVAGRTGEFTVWVDGKVVVRQSWLRLPADRKVLQAVRSALK